MAIQQGDDLSGKLGNRIYSVDPLTKKQVVRSRPKKVRNPRTAAQQEHRSRFLDIVQLSSRMTEVHEIGLHYYAQRAKLRTYTYFRSINKDCFTSDGRIDYRHLVLSRGSVERVYLRSVHVEASASEDESLVVMTFDVGHASDADDRIYLYVYCPAQSQGRLSAPVPRSEGMLSVAVPTEWLRQEPGEPTPVHLYAFAQGKNLRTSDAIYMPLPSK